MAFKFVAFATLVAAASAGILQPAPLVYHAVHAAPSSYSHSAPIAYAAPVAKAVIADPYEHAYDPHPQYSYSYDVHDTHTGDMKNQHETRNGDAVEGSYSFIEADGSRRVVHYTADDHHGFNAVVEKQPAEHTVHQAVHPVAHHAPIVAYQHSSPVVQVAAPLRHYTYAAPSSHAAYGYADQHNAAPAHSYHH